MFAALQLGITGRAIRENLVSINFWNPRDFTVDKHQSVDDSPYGGGAGMVMMAGPIKAALDAAKIANRTAITQQDEVDYMDPLVIYLSPQGQMFDQGVAKELSKKKSIVLLAGRYEGIDERIIANEVDIEISIGNYILTGGELAAMVVMDTTIRLLAGVVGDQASVSGDSLNNGLLKYPQYTRPLNFSGSNVPEVLVSGHHQEISRWRKRESLGRTWLKRPDLLEKCHLDQDEKELLDEFIEQYCKYV